MNKVCVVVNPQSANGKTGRRLPELRALLEASFGEATVRLTKAVGHGTELAAEAAREGFDLLICVGGDGSANEVVNGLFDGKVPRAPSMALGVLPAGTGGDLVRTLHMPRPWHLAVPAIANGRDRVVDVMHTVMEGHDGAEVRRLCVNVAGFGINGEVVARVNRSTKLFGGRATFLGATLGTSLVYKPKDVTLRWRDAEDREGSWSGPLMSGFAANAHYTGGGMWVGKGGAIDDGVMELVIIPPKSPLQTLRATPRLYDGTVRELYDTVHASVRWLRAEAGTGDPVLVDLDGEQPGMLPLELEVLPSVLTIRAPWGT